MLPSKHCSHFVVLFRSLFLGICVRVCLSSTTAKKILCTENISQGIYNCNNVPLGVLLSNSFFSNTRCLLLSNSSLQAIPPLAAINLTNLITLDLSNNMINSFDKDTFANLTFLKYLDIRGNKVLELTPLPKGVFNSLYRLEGLKITIMNMVAANVDRFVDESVVFRESLNFLSIQKGSLKAGAYIASQFGQLTSLELYLLEGNITAQRQLLTTLRNLTKVESLSIRSCAISTLGDSDLDWMAKLKHLNLACSALTFP